MLTSRSLQRYIENTGECLLISSLHVPGKALRTLVDIARLAKI